MNDERIRELRWAASFMTVQPERHGGGRGCEYPKSCVNCREWERQRAKVAPGLTEVLDALEQEREAQVYAMREAEDKAREEYRINSLRQLTIGGVLEALSCAIHIRGEDEVAQVRGPTGDLFNCGGDIGSYRGFYEQCAISVSGPGSEEGVTTIGQLDKRLRWSLSATHTGYKGGEYKFQAKTKVWVSNYNDASGWEVVDVDRNGLIITRRWNG